MKFYSLWHQNEKLFANFCGIWNSVFHIAVDLRHFINHVDFEGGIIIGVNLRPLELEFFPSLKLIVGYIVPTIDHVVLVTVKILFFVRSAKNVAAYDLFDFSISTYLSTSVKENQLKLRYNQTGEEFYICASGKYIWVYRSNYANICRLLPLKNYDG